VGVGTIFVSDIGSYSVKRKDAGRGEREQDHSGNSEKGDRNTDSESACGFDVIGVCTSGVQILNYADVLEEGIVICSCQLKDMVYGELRADLPQSFEMLVLTTGRHPVEETAHIRTLSLPLKVQELLEQVRAMEEMFEWQRRKRRGRKSERNERQNQIISRAKAQLMEKKEISGQ